MRAFRCSRASRLNSLTSISNQALAILVRRDVERQRATLTPQDLLMQPALGERSSYDFSSVASAVAAGEVAARIAQPRLAGLAVAPARGPAPASAGPSARATRVSRSCSSLPPSPAPNATCR